MRNTRVASRYAKSLLHLAVEQGQLDAVHKDMEAIQSICKESRELTMLMESPVVKGDKKWEILQQVFKDAISEMTLSFIKILVSKRRESHMPVIAETFIAQYLEHKNILRAVVRSANGVDDNLRNKVKELVKGVSNSDVQLVEEVDPSLIGGFVLTVGDQQVDASIARKLSNLRRTYSENPYIKEL